MDYLPIGGYKETQSSSYGSKIIEFIQTLAVFAAIAVAIYVFIGQPHKVSGSSMFPTLHSGDYILTDKLSYRFREPQKQEIIVFKNPREETQDFIKRIIAAPKDKVKVENGSVYVNGSVLSESYLKTSHLSTTGSFLSEGREVIIPENRYVVMGDNRAASSDSREWGFITKEEIIGKAIFRYWPPNALGLIIN